MENGARALIRPLPTGVPGLDEVLGGGLPEYSFNVIAGPPGSGKTTLAHQILFANASEDRRGLYFTVLGEPSLKMLRYQQQFSFFDMSKVDSAIRFVNLAEEVQRESLDSVLESIVREVEQHATRFVAVDSFRSLVRGVGLGGGRRKELQSFVQRLSLHLAAWEATTFLIGEYAEAELLSNPVFTIADGLLWLSQYNEGNAVTRKLQVRKVRGQAEMGGLHGYRVTRQGIRVFPRHPQLPETLPDLPAPRPRLSMGVAGLDEMLCGGIPAGDIILVAGPLGSGKTLLTSHFLAAGEAEGEPGVVVLFEEPPGQFTESAEHLGFEHNRRVREGSLKLIYLRPGDMSPAEILDEIRAAVAEIGARRVAIDSVTGLEICLAASFREEFRESLYRLARGLAAEGVTVLLTIETTESFTEMRIAPQHPISFVVDDVILQRYIEVDGELRRVLAVIKMRRSQHSQEFRAYEIRAGAGLVVLEALKGYRGLLLGVPEWRGPPVPLPGAPTPDPGSGDG